MLIRKYLTYFLISTLLVPILVQAIESDLWSQEIETYTEMVEVFHNICFDEEGKFLDNSATSVDGNLINCNEQAIALDEHYNALESNIINLSEVNGEEIYCSNVLQSEDDALEPLANLSAEIETNSVSCEKKSDCYAGLACNAIRSFLPGAAIGMSLTSGLYERAQRLYSREEMTLSDSSSLSELRNCGDMTNGSCALNMFRGVWDSLYSTADSLWQIAKFTGRKVKSGFNYVVDSIGSWFSEVEDSTSEKMMAAQQLDDSMLDKFVADPIGFIVDATKALLSAIETSAIEHYGCEKWSGAPYISQCLRPMSNWDCASCSQRMNFICGVGGFAGGEIIVAYLTGGAIAVAKVGASATTRVGGRVATQLSQSLAQLPRGEMVVDMVLGVRSGLVGAAKFLGRNALRSWKVLKESHAFKKLKEAVKIAKDSVVATGGTPGISRSIKIVSYTAEVTTLPLRKYLRLMDRAFDQGFKQTQRALTKGQLTAGAEIATKIERNLHSDWRKEFQATNGEMAQRFKEVPEEAFKAGETAEQALLRLQGEGYSNLKIQDNKLVQDINVKAERIVPELNRKLNGALADDYAEIILKRKITSKTDIQDTAAEIHEVWMRHSSWQRESNPNLFVNYSNLPASEKIKNVQILKRSLEARDSTVVLQPYFTEYLLGLEVELLYEKVLYLLTKDGQIGELLKTQDMESAVIETHGIILKNQYLMDKLGLPNGVSYIQMKPEQKMKVIEFLEEVMKSDEALTNNVLDLGRYKQSIENEFTLIRNRDIIGKISNDIKENLHAEWRVGFRANNGREATRFKPVPTEALRLGETPQQALSRLSDEGFSGLAIEEGVLVQNINTEATNLIPELNHKLNGALADDYAQLAISADFSTARAMEEAASEVHEIWMKHNSWQRESSPELFVDFASLPRGEQLKDVEVLESVLRSSNPQLADGQMFQNYKNRFSRQSIDEEVLIFLGKNRGLQETLESGDELYKGLVTDSATRQRLVNFLKNANEDELIALNQSLKQLEIMRKAQDPDFLIWMEKVKNTFRRECF